MKLPIIQSLWIGDRLSALERLSLASFLHHGHVVHLYVYDNVAHVPEGVVLQDATTVLPAARIFKYRKRDSYAGFSNLFRYKLLHERGGCWTDVDLICLAPIADHTGHRFVSERIGVARRRRGWWRRWWQRLHVRECASGSAKQSCVTTCFIQTPAGSSIMASCYRKADQMDPKTLKWGETGPQLLAKEVAQFNLGSCVAPPEMFCPIACCNWRQAIEANPAANLLDGAQCLHLWHEMWRRNQVDKNGVFAASSIYEQLKRRYL